MVVCILWLKILRGIMKMEKKSLLPGQYDKGHRKAQTKFSCTRFGYVLASGRSVIPLFKDHIANGGQVT